MRTFTKVLFFAYPVVKFPNTTFFRWLLAAAAAALWSSYAKPVGTPFTNVLFVLSLN